MSLAAFALFAILAMPSAGAPYFLCPDISVAKGPGGIKIERKRYYLEHSGQYFLQLNTLIHAIAEGKEDVQSPAERAVIIVHILRGMILRERAKAARMRSIVECVKKGNIRLMHCLRTANNNVYANLFCAHLSGAPERITFSDNLSESILCPGIKAYKKVFEARTSEKDINLLTTMDSTFDLEYHLHHLYKLPANMRDYEKLNILTYRIIPTCIDQNP